MESSNSKTPAGNAGGERCPLTDLRHRVQQQRGDLVMKDRTTSKGRVPSAALNSNHRRAVESTTASRRPSSETPDPQVADWDPIGDWSVKQIAGYFYSDLADFVFGEIGIHDL